jgi:hypothetical protein
MKYCLSDSENLMWSDKEVETYKNCRLSAVAASWNKLWQPCIC